MKYPSASELFVILTKTKFKPFTKVDWVEFEGCESEDPLIGRYKKFTIVIDDNRINVVHADDWESETGGELYEMNCHNMAEE